MLHVMKKYSSYYNRFHWNQSCSVKHVVLKKVKILGILKGHTRQDTTRLSRQNNENFMALYSSRTQIGLENKSHMNDIWHRISTVKYMMQM